VPATFVLITTMITFFHPLTETRLREMIVEIAAPVVEA
jgi:Na+/melibiose symporter-like transporter